MARRKQYTEADIVAEAMQVVREGGLDSLSARVIAERLNSSTMPIYSTIQSMDRLIKLVFIRAFELYLEFFFRHKTGNILLDVYLGQILFAKEEKHLFRMLFLNESIYQFRDRASQVFEEVTCGYLDRLFPALRPVYREFMESGMDHVAFGVSCAVNFEYTHKLKNNSVGWYEKVLRETLGDRLKEFEGIDPEIVAGIFDEAVEKIRDALVREIGL